MQVQDHFFSGRRGGEGGECLECCCSGSPDISRTIPGGCIVLVSSHRKEQKITGEINHNPDNLETHLVVQRTDVKRRVPRCVLSAHVRSVEQQMLQVLHVAVAASLHARTHTRTHAH